MGIHEELEKMIMVMEVLDYKLTTQKSFEEAYEEMGVPKKEQLSEKEVIDIMTRLLKKRSKGIFVERMP